MRNDKVRSKEKKVTMMENHDGKTSEFFIICDLLKKEVQGNY